MVVRAGRRSVDRAPDWSPDRTLRSRFSCFVEGRVLIGGEVADKATMTARGGMTDVRVHYVQQEDYAYKSTAQRMCSLSEEKKERGEERLREVTSWHNEGLTGNALRMSITRARSSKSSLVQQVGGQQDMVPPSH
jgi:hypothetical protein